MAAPKILGELVERFERNRESYLALLRFTSSTIVTVCKAAVKETQANDSLARLCCNRQTH